MITRGHKYKDGQPENRMLWRLVAGEGMKTSFFICIRKVAAHC